MASSSLGIGIALVPTAAAAQTKETPAERDATREEVRAILASVGPRDDVAIAFRQSTQERVQFRWQRHRPHQLDSLEVVISVTEYKTVSFRVYPHYHGGYINLNRAKDRAGLMHKLLEYNDTNFLFFGADDTNDVFAGYTFTLEFGLSQRSRDDRPAQPPQPGCRRNETADRRQIAPGQTPLSNVRIQPPVCIGVRAGVSAKPQLIHFKSLPAG